MGVEAWFERWYDPYFASNYNSDLTGLNYSNGAWYATGATRLQGAFSTFTEPLLMTTRNAKRGWERIYLPSSLNNRTARQIVYGGGYWVLDVGTFAVSTNLQTWAVNANSAPGELAYSAAQGWTAHSGFGRYWSPNGAPTGTWTELKASAPNGDVVYGSTTAQQLNGEYVVAFIYGTVAGIVTADTGKVAVYACSDIFDPASSWTERSKFGGRDALSQPSTGAAIAIEYSDGTYYVTTTKYVYRASSLSGPWTQTYSWTSLPATLVRVPAISDGVTALPVDTAFPRAAIGYAASPSGPYGLAEVEDMLGDGTLQSGRIAKLVRSDTTNEWVGVGYDMDTNNRSHAAIWSTNDGYSGSAYWGIEL